MSFALATNCFSSAINLARLKRLRKLLTQTKSQDWPGCARRAIPTVSAILFEKSFRKSSQENLNANEQSLGDKAERNRLSSFETGLASTSFGLVRMLWSV
jgi:hypothetical protein